MAVWRNDLYLLLNIYNPFEDKSVILFFYYLGEVQKEMNYICSLNKLEQ